MVYQLSDTNNAFPDPRLIPDVAREPYGFFAVGGDLSPARLWIAYHYGIFPWTAFRSISHDPQEKRTAYNQIRWYCPVIRFVIFPDEIHISHSMRTLLNKHRYHVTFDEDYAAVIRGCAETRMEMDGAWLGPEMIEAYERIHDEGWSHSVEVWDGDKLVGGLYGQYIGTAFIGESMFSRVPSASKIALIALARHLKEIGGRVIDCQLETPHLRSMGGRCISYEKYLLFLKPDKANKQP